MCYIGIYIEFDLEGKSSIGLDIEFEKKEQLANIRFRTQTNVYRTTLVRIHIQLLENLLQK